MAIAKRLVSGTPILVKIPRAFRALRSSTISPKARLRYVAGAEFTRPLPEAREQWHLDPPHSTLLPKWW
jgi:hypothetical protein